jgi:hypothetical protein
MGLLAENVKDFFDDPRAPADILKEAAQFLERRQKEMEHHGRLSTDLLFYFVGHAGFVGSDNAYCLFLKFTQERLLRPTSLHITDLAEVFQENARHLRRYFILDACFAGAAPRFIFQSSRGEMIRRELDQHLPRKGVALLCSSSSQHPSKAPKGERYTMFTGALLDVLMRNQPREEERLSLRVLGRLTADLIRDRFENAAVRPEVHSPDQRDGDLADVPLFPNPPTREPTLREQAAGKSNPAGRSPPDTALLPQMPEVTPRVDPPHGEALPLKGKRIRPVEDSRGLPRVGGEPLSCSALAVRTGAEPVNVFISHASEDSQLALGIAEILEENGYSTWYYERDTLPSISYLVQYGKAIDGAHAFLLLVSKHSLASTDVSREFEQAHRRGDGPRFLPVLAGVTQAEVRNRRPTWHAALETAAPMELRDRQIRPLADCLLQTLQSWNIQPLAPKKPPRKRQKTPVPGLPRMTRVWASDANQIDIQDIDRVVFRNAIIEEFFQGRTKHFVSANKGLGKTLLLSCKRNLLTEAAQRTQVFLVPEGKPYLDFMSDLPEQAGSHEAFLATLVNAKRLWALAFRISALSYHPSLFTAEDADELKRLPKRLAGWLQGGKVEPTVVFKEVLGNTLKQINRLIDEGGNFLEHKFRLIHSAMFFFVDKVDQGIRSLSRQAWIHVQAGLIEAAWDAMNANSHIKIYASIRQEAFSNYESDIKTNLFGATTIIQYSDADLSRLLDQLTKCYEGSKTFKEMVNLHVVRHSQSGFPEDSFQYLKRHTLGRPRDLVIVASELSRNQGSLTEALYRKVVCDTSASVLVANVFEEMRVFLTCLHDRQDRLRFLSLLPHNILTRQDLIEVYCAFNRLDPDAFDAVGPDSEGMWHPFWELYSAGLLGVVVPSREEGRAKQRFKQPSDLLDDSQSALPNVSFYLIHPSLDELIRKQRSSGSYNVFQHIVVGHSCPWESYYGTFYKMERALFAEEDKELCGLVHDVLKEITVPLSVGRREAVPSVLADSPAWAELTTRFPERCQDDFYVRLEELVT